MTHIKAIIFDFGGTLDGDGIDWFTRIYQGILEQLPDLELETFEIHARTAADSLDLLEDIRRLTLDQTATRLCRNIHTELKNADAKYNDLDPQRVSNEFIANAHQCLKRNRNVLRLLQDEYRLGCISNNWGNTAGWCRQFQLDELFQTIIDSTVLGVTKPDTDIFLAALNELQLPPDQCAYVGDSYNADVIGAYNAGLTPIWVTNNHQKLPKDSFIIPQRITQIPDLLKKHILS
ncbi:MAG: HAD family hydrolase [Sedimentisphaerales bacterium]|nr:HAD family hydrolase [Sedimentisphaerales bacterium]